jgi:hypothetical protein
VAAARSDTEAALSGAEPLLIERIDAEYGRYFTGTGRPTGEWGAAISQLANAEAAVQDCAAAVAEVDERVRRHAVLTQQVAELSQLRLAAGPRLVAAHAADAKIAELTRQAREAKLVAAAAAATNAAAAAAHSGRLRLLAEIETRAAGIAAADADAQEAANAGSATTAEAEAADAAVEESIRVLTIAQRRVECARRTVDRLADRDEAGRLKTRLAKIDAIEHDRECVCAELAGVAITEELLQEIESAAAAVDRTGDQLELNAAVVEFTAAADIEFVVGHQRVSLSAGQTWSITASGPTDVEVPGVLTARIAPGETALDVQAKYAAAQHELTAALCTADTADLAAARRALQHRRELQGNRDQLSATLAGLRGDEDIAQLHSRLAELSAAQLAEPDLLALDVTGARAELDAAEASRAAAEAECEARRRVAAAAGCRLAETSTRATVLLNTATGQRVELDAAGDRLTQERATVSDEDLASAAQAALRSAQTAEQQAADLAAELAAAAPDAVAAEFDAATEAAESLSNEYEAAARALREVNIELAVFGSEGRQGKLDAAEIDREHAAGQHTRVGGRARAAQLLRSVMARHRDTTRLGYVEPYRTELQRLGRPVFGPSFEVDIDSNLCIRSRTVDGITVPYESLSGGAKEQLGILARLAGAALVAKEDTVPVVIDDALGFTDPDRLARMGEVFDAVGTQGQVIVLTCSPDRYDRVKGAHRIDLNV